jgi:hypothetical protein
MLRPTLTDKQKELITLIEEQFAKRPNGIRGNNRPKKSTGTGRSVAYGFVRRRSYPPGPSAENKKWPALYTLLKQYGETVGLAWDSIQVNIDCVCGKHRDVGNFGDSYLLSGGDYTGGELVIEDVEYNCRYAPIIFNGSEREHWNKTMTGRKWSIIFFQTLIPNQFSHLFPENWRTTYPNYKDEFMPGCDVATRKSKVKSTLVVGEGGGEGGEVPQEPS